MAMKMGFCGDDDDGCVFRRLSWRCSSYDEACQSLTMVIVMTKKRFDSDYDVMIAF